MLLGLVALGDVADDSREKSPRSKLYLADGEVHGEGGAVLAQADDLAADADDLLLPGGQVIVQVAVVLVAVRLGHEHLDVLADDLARRVAEQPLRRRVHRLDHAASVDRDDRVHGGFEDRPCPRLAILKLADGMAQVGDIAGDAGEHAAVAKMQFADGKVHGKGAAVLAKADDFAADADDLFLPGGQVIIQVAVVLVAVWLGHEHLDVLAEDLVRRVAEESLRRRVHRLDNAARVDREDGIHGRVEDRPRPGFAMFQLSDGGSEIRDIAGDPGEHATVAELQAR